MPWIPTINWCTRKGALSANWFYVFIDTAPVRPRTEQSSRVRDERRGFTPSPLGCFARHHKCATDLRWNHSRYRGFPRWIRSSSSARLPRPPTGAASGTRANPRFRQQSASSTLTWPSAAMAAAQASIKSPTDVRRDELQVGSQPVERCETRHLALDLESFNSDNCAAAASKAAWAPGCRGLVFVTADNTTAHCRRVALMKSGEFFWPELSRISAASDAGNLPQHPFEQVEWSVRAGQRWNPVRNSVCCADDIAANAGSDRFDQRQPRPGVNAVNQRKQVLHEGEHIGRPAGSSDLQLLLAKRGSAWIKRPTRRPGLRTAGEPHRKLVGDACHQRRGVCVVGLRRVADVLACLMDDMGGKPRCASRLARRRSARRRSDKAGGEFGSDAACAHGRVETSRPNSGRVRECVRRAAGAWPTVERIRSRRPRRRTSGLPPRRSASEFWSRTPMPDAFECSGEPLGLRVNCTPEASAKSSRCTGNRRLDEIAQQTCQQSRARSAPRRPA